MTCPGARGLIARRRSPAASGSRRSAPEAASRAAAMLLALLLGSSCGPAPGPQIATPASGPAPAPATVPAGRCTLCGMDTGRSGARFLLDLRDGTSLDACGAGCAAELLRSHGSPLYRARVLAHDAGTLVDATEATYVLGSDTLPPGSMPPSVFAFARGEAAREFVAAHGGRTGSFADVLGIGAPGASGAEGAP